ECTFGSGLGPPRNFDGVSFGESGAERQLGRRPNDCSRYRRSLRPTEQPADRKKRRDAAHDDRNDEDNDTVGPHVPTSLNSQPTGARGILQNIPPIPFQGFDTAYYLPRGDSPTLDNQAKVFSCQR